MRRRFVSFLQFYGSLFAGSSYPVISCNTTIYHVNPGILTLRLFKNIIHIVNRKDVLSLIRNHQQLFQKRSKLPGFTTIPESAKHRAHSPMQVPTNLLATTLGAQAESLDHVQLDYLWQDRSLPRPPRSAWGTCQI